MVGLTHPAFQDRIPQPRGFGMKLFNVHGVMFEAGKDFPTQDIEFNRLVFSLSRHVFRYMTRLVHGLIYRPSRDSLTPQLALTQFQKRKSLTHILEKHPGAGPGGRQDDAGDHRAADPVRRRQGGAVRAAAAAAGRRAADGARPRAQHAPRVDAVLLADGVPLRRLRRQVLPHARDRDAAAPRRGDHDTRARLRRHAALAAGVSSVSRR